MSMKILIANKFWYRRGGDCVYSMALKNLLEAQGHEVAVYAMQYSENDPSSWSGYWPSEMNMAKAMVRPIGSCEVKKTFTRLLDDFNPDVLHLNNIHTQLSPVIAEIAHEKGVKVVWTLHDYKLLCPRYDCLQRGVSICEDCFSTKIPVLGHRCMKNSLPASIIAYAEALKWSQKRLSTCTDAFICPSKFLLQKMRQGGFPELKLHHLCNFIDTEKCVSDSYSVRDDYYCFVGRLSHEKGIETLIQAASRLPHELVVVGDGPLRETLENEAGSNVRFVGRKEWGEIKQLLGHARFMVIPSEWYENNPISVIESLCLGTPVLGADIGGIPELIEESRGRCFSPFNVDKLADEIETMFSSSFDYDAIAGKSQEEFNSNKYYEFLLNLYQQTLSKKHVTL